MLSEGFADTAQFRFLRWHVVGFFAQIRSNRRYGAGEEGIGMLALVKMSLRPGLLQSWIGLKG